MFKNRLCYLQLIFLGRSFSDLIFQVQRRADHKSGIEPYVPEVFFENTDPLCFFAYCWNKEGRCKAAFNCCECVCKDRKTYFSVVSGCLSALEVLTETRITGLACKFVTPKIKFSYIPLFSQSHNFNDIKLTLPVDKAFPLSNETTQCDAGEVYIYDYHGHKLLYDRNECNELFILRSHKGTHYLHWQSLESKKWDMLKGQLISVDISCKNKEQGESLKSCFVFQVEGKFVQGKHWQPPTPSTKVCPTTSKSTWTPPTEETTTTITTTTTTTAKPTAEATTTLTTTEPTTTSDSTTTLSITNENQRNSKNLVGIATGIVTGIVIIIGCVLVAIFIIKKKKKKSNDVVQMQNLIKQPTRANAYIDQPGNYASRPNNRLNEFAEGKVVGLPGDDEKTLKSCEYASIDAEPHYESTEQFRDQQWKRHSSEMSKRPLPSKPQESENPYYCTTNDIQQPAHDRVNAENQLYESLDAIEVREK